jgi:hypothetical protein
MIEVLGRFGGEHDPLWWVCVPNPSEQYPGALETCVMHGGEFVAEDRMKLDAMPAAPRWAILSRQHTDGKPVRQGKQGVRVTAAQVEMAL